MSVPIASCLSGFVVSAVLVHLVPVAYLGLSAMPYLAILSLPIIGLADARHRPKMALGVSAFVIGSYLYLFWMYRRLLQSVELDVLAERALSAATGTVGEVTNVAEKSEQLAKLLTSGFRLTSIGILPWLGVAFITWRSD